MSSSYNLLNQPWIKVVDSAGKNHEVSLRELFVRAQDFKRIAGESPAQDFAILRIALSVIYRAFDFSDASSRSMRNNAKKWAQAWDDKRLPLDAIQVYLDKYEHRFNLIDDDEPFMQTPSLASKKGEWKSLEVLVPDSPELGGLFYRRDPQEPMDFAEAARWLVHCMAFDYSGIKTGAEGDTRVKGGRGYPIGIGWSGWLGGTSLEGQNLLETLLLNVVDDTETAWAGTPIWEAPVPTAAEAEEPLEVGQLTLFTWPQRRIRLRVEDNMVTGVLVCNGDPVDYIHQDHVETMTPWRYSKPQSAKAKEDIYMPQAVLPDRAIWRGLPSILPVAERRTDKGRSGQQVDMVKPSAVANALTKRVRHEKVSPDYKLRVRIVGYEYGAQMASYNRLLFDELAMPALLTADETAAEAAVKAAQYAQDTANEIRKFANNLAIAAGGERGPAGASAQEAFYSEVDSKFRLWIENLNSAKDFQEPLNSWIENLYQLANAQSEELVSQVPDSAWQGREQDNRLINVGNAHTWFRIGLSKVLPKPDDSTEPVKTGDPSITDEKEEK